MLNRDEAQPWDEWCYEDSLHSDDEYTQFEDELVRTRLLLVNQRSQNLGNPPPRAGEQVALQDEPSRWSTALSPNQLQVARDFCPKSTEGWRCWLCRKFEHSLFNCPYLTEEQSLFGAYRNSLYKDEVKGVTSVPCEMRSRGPTRG